MSSGSIGNGLVCRDVKITATSLNNLSGNAAATEAEWELAARAGTTTAFYNGDIEQRPDLNCYDDPTLDKIGWYCFNADKLTHPVEQKLPNAWGLFDMSGNAMEWVDDQFNGLGYGDGPVVDPGGTLTGLTYPDGGHAMARALRSGLVTGPANTCTSSNRWELDPSIRSPGFGFRLARTKL